MPGAETLVKYESLQTLLTAAVQSLFKRYATYAAMLAALPSIDSDCFIRVATDEDAGGTNTLYRWDGENLTFIVEQEITT